MGIFKKNKPKTDDQQPIAPTSPDNVKETTAEKVRRIVAENRAARNEREEGRKNK